MIRKEKRTPKYKKAGVLIKQFYNTKPMTGVKHHSCMYILEELTKEN
jgi:hypothetical protein